MKPHKRIMIVLAVIVLVGAAFVLKYVCSHLLINLLYDDLGNRNWHVELHYGYSIVENNGDDIILVKDGWDSTNDIVISSKIISYYYDSKYAAFMCSAQSSGGEPDDEDFRLTVYLLDMEADILLGTFDETEFYEYCYDNNILSNVEWIKTSPRPSEAEYN